MRTHLLLCLLPLTFGSAANAGPLRHHGRHHHRLAAAGPYVAPAVRDPSPPYDVPPLAGTAGTAIPPEAARFMGYPYDVPGYRYAGYDACLLRVGGPFGPGPSAGRCPFGLDRAF